MWSCDKAQRNAEAGPRSVERLSGAHRGMRTLLALLAFGAAVPLASCIQPLYGANGAFDASPLASELQAIEVDEIPGRIGHYLRNDLIYGFNGTGSAVAPRYRLSVVLRERVQTPILDTVTGRATSATVIVDADYKLVTWPQNVLVTQGTAFNIASYDRFSNRFSNVRAARDAEIRDARVIADSIRTRISTEMAMREPAPTLVH